MDKDIESIDLDQLRKRKELNARQRRDFIRTYVKWLKKTPNKVWSRQQKEFLDAD